MKDQEKAEFLDRGESHLNATLPLAEMMGAADLVRGGLALISLQRQLLTDTETITLSRQETTDLIALVDQTKKALGI